VSIKAPLEELGPGLKLLLSGILVLLIGLFSQVLAALLVSWFYSFPFNELFSPDAYSDPQTIAAMKWVQIIGGTGTFILPALLLSWLFTGDPLAWFQPLQRMETLPVILTVLMMCSIIPFINYSAELNMRLELPLESLEEIFRELELQAEELLQAFTSSSSWSSLLVNILMIAVLAAVGEELIFRGVFQRLLTQWIRNIHLAVLLTSILFSAIHFQFYSFLPRLILGMILGYLFYYGSSIWYPILAHFVNNALGVVYYHFHAPGESEAVLDEIGTSQMMPRTAIISLSLFLFFALWWYFRVRSGTSPSPRSGAPGTGSRSPHSF